MSDDTKTPKGAALPAVVVNPGILPAASVEALTAHVDLIGRIAKEVLKEDKHYGKIPGVKKPTLLKPGAEMLAMTFHLRPIYEVLGNSVERDDFISYVVRCSLESMGTGGLVATGIGACNSREDKYRIRWVPTDRPVPKEYWKDRDRKILGGEQYKAGKDDADNYVICERGENLNPWNEQNTILKMAEKRALIAAVLNAVAASEYFTQDVEDKGDGKDEGAAKSRKSGAKNPDPAADANRHARLDEIKKLGAEAASYGITAETKAALQEEVLGGRGAKAFAEAPLEKLEELKARLVALIYTQTEEPTAEGPPAAGPPSDIYVDLDQRIKEARTVDDIDEIGKDFNFACMAQPPKLTSDEIEDIKARYKVKEAQLKAAAAKGGK